MPSPQKKDNHTLIPKLVNVTLHLKKKNFFFLPVVISVKNLEMEQLS